MGSELVDWLLEQCPFVKCRSTAVGVWQLLLDMGIILSGQSCWYFQCEEGYPFLLHRTRAVVLIRGGEGKQQRLIQFSCQIFFLLSFWETHFFDLSFPKYQRSSPCFWQFHSFFHSCNCLLSSCRLSVRLFFSPQAIFGFSQDSSCLVAADHGFTR